MEYVTVKTFCDSMELTPEESKYILNYVNDRTGGERCDFSTSVSLLELVEALEDLKKSDVYGSDYVDPNDPEDAWNPSKGLYPKQYEMNMQWSSRKNKLRESGYVAVAKGKDGEHYTFSYGEDSKDPLDGKWKKFNGTIPSEEENPIVFEKRKDVWVSCSSKFGIGDVYAVRVKYGPTGLKESFDEEYGEDIDNMHKVKELFKQELWHPTENHSKQMKQAMAYVVHFIRESEQRKKKRV